MTKRRIWYSVTIILVLLLLCAALLPSIDKIITSFPEIVVGQVVLARETKPISARAYQSAEFVLNQVGLSEIERAVYISLDDDVLWWEPQYVGFLRTELREDEIHILKELLLVGNLFHGMPDGSSYQCVVQNALQGPKLGPCAHGKQFMDQYSSYQWQAKQDHAVGVLQFFLTGGRLAEIRIYPSEQGLAFTPYETSGGWWLHGITASSPLLEGLSARVTIPSISVLWPEMTTDQANRRAARIIGDRYQRILEIIQNSSTVSEVFGHIQEIRPAVGNNYYSSWMDSTSVFLTFRIIGARGEGAAIIQGYDCFDLQMVFQGIPMDDGRSYGCSQKSGGYEARGWRASSNSLRKSSGSLRTGMPIIQSANCLSIN